MHGKKLCFCNKANVVCVSEAVSNGGVSDSLCLEWNTPWLSWWLLRLRLNDFGLFDVLLFFTWINLYRSGPRFQNRILFEIANELPIINSPQSICCSRHRKSRLFTYNADSRTLLIDDKSKSHGCLDSPTSSFCPHQRVRHRERYPDIHWLLEAFESRSRICCREMPV